MRTILPLAVFAGLLALPTGCVKRALVTPAEDHKIQTRVIAEACEAEGYGFGRCTAEDLQAMVDQACLIDAVLKGEDPETCGAKGAGQ